MIRKILILLLALSGYRATYAQQEDSASHLRISLLTCGPGDEDVWEVFGHTGLRVIDSVAHTDEVFNYGTFDFGPDFELQFMRGKLLYSLTIDSYKDFMQEYVEAKRSVQEQELLLDWKQKEHVYYFLELNAEPENKYYKYDFFFDNCATRIRDIFPRHEVFGKAFHYGQTIPPGKSISFRDIINQYFYRDHWTRLGVNILLGSRIDRVMTNSDIMFLPDYLRDGIGGATVNGNKIATPPVLILPGNPLSASAGINWALVLTSLLALLTIAGLSFKRLQLLGQIMSVLLLFVTGLLGCLILVMWFATDHQGCANNFNILWCLPTNIIIAFFNPKGKPKYALVAMFLILVSILLSLLKVQGLIPEFAPLLLALLYIHGMIYRRSRIKVSVQNA